MNVLEGKIPSAPRILGQADILRAVEYLEGWNFVGGRLERWFECAHFPAAIAWVTQLVDLAESMGHHPDVDVRYRRVRLTLVTYGCGACVTDWDVELASRIDRLWRMRQEADVPN